MESPRILEQETCVESHCLDSPLNKRNLSEGVQNEVMNSSIIQRLSFSEDFPLCMRDYK